MTNPNMKRVKQIQFSTNQLNRKQIIKSHIDSQRIFNKAIINQYLKINTQNIGKRDEQYQYSRNLGYSYFSQALKMMSSSDEEITKNNRNISTTQYSPQLRPHNSVNYGICQFCNMNLGARMLKNSKSNLQILSKSQHLQDTYFGGGQSYKFKKSDQSEFEKKMKKAGKEIERLNRIIADQSIELEALNFVKQISQYEVDTVVIQENSRLKKEIEELQNQLNILAHPESQADNSETFNYWNDRKDSEKLQMDFSNIIDLDDNGDINNENFNLELGLNRIDDIKKMLLEEYKFFKHLQSEPTLSVHIEEYSKKRHELLATFQKLQHSLFPMCSPVHDKKILNVSRKQSVFYDEVTPSNKSTLDFKLQFA